ncbi:MAG: MFS transporter [Dehalococcoidia bacterium]
MSLPSYFSRTFYSLENEKFRLLWLGTLFSFIGMQMQVIARGFLAYELTGSNTALGGVMLAFGLPQFVLGPWGGVFADRLPKRNLIIGTQAIIALNSLWIAVLISTGDIEYWHLVAAGVVQGASFAFQGPARQAFTSDLVGRDAIGNAVVLQQLSMNSTRVVGPSLAGVFIAVSFIGVEGVYFLTSLGFVAAMVTNFRLPAGAPHPRERQVSPLSDLLDGLRYIRHRPSISLLILTSFLVVMVGFPYQSFLPSIAKDVYSVGPLGLGMLSTMSAIGAVIATVFVATYAAHKRAWYAQPLLAIAFGGSLVLLAATANFVAGLIAIVLVGALASAFQSLNNSLTMSMSEPEYHGRVQSISMLSWSLFGLFALPVGIVADHIGIRETLALQGGLVIVTVTALQLMRRTSAAEDRDKVVLAMREHSHTPAGLPGR